MAAATCWAASSAIASGYSWLSIGIVGGAGIGLAYVVPISVCVKWFPDKKGLITGLAVAGFGFGATIWVKLAGSWFGGLLNTTTVFGLPGVQSVFVIYGIALAALVLLGSFVMVNPPEDYLPAGWTPPVTENNDHEGAVEFRARDMLRTPQFYMLWLVFMFAGISGLMVIYCIKLFGIDALEHHGVTGAGAITGTAMAWYAIFNGVGRIAWGSISDRIGRKNNDHTDGGTAGHHDANDVPRVHQLRPCLRIYRRCPR